MAVSRRWPIGMRACRSPTGCICRRSGRATARVGARRGFRSAFKTKPEIALDQLRWADAAGLPRGVVLLDAGYGNNSDLRADITALGLTYAAGILFDDHGVGARRPAVAGQNMVGPRTTTKADPARRQASAGLGQGACAQPGEAGLANHRMA